MKMNSHLTHVCDGCSYMVHRVNGRYCARLQCLAEYAVIRPCQSTPQIEGLTNKTF